MPRLFVSQVTKAVHISFFLIFVAGVKLEPDPSLSIDTHLIDAYNELMRVHFKPKTKLGRCSAWLIVAFAVFFGSLQALIASGQRGGDTFFSNLVLAIPGLLSASSGIAAFVTGLISIIKKKERAVAIYFAVGFGLITLIFVLGELIFPH